MPQDEVSFVGVPEAPKVDGALHVNVPSHRVFPTLDFKFQNTGSATAILWKFTVIVEKVSVDPAPDLSAYISVRDPHPDDPFSEFLGGSVGRYLCLAIRNNGWGPALDGRFVVAGDSLDQLFSIGNRSLRSELPAGASLNFTIDSNLIDGSQLTTLRHLLASKAEQELEATLPARFREWLHQETSRRKRKAQREYTRLQLEMFRQEFSRLPMPADFSSGLFQRFTPKDGEIPAVDTAAAYEEFSQAQRESFRLHWTPTSPIPLGPIALRYEAQDNWSRPHRGTITPNMGGNMGGSLSVGPNGFVHCQHNAPLCALTPSVVYCCILDPDCGAHSREYPISRQVPPGDVENFQIVIGSTKSAHFRLRLRFNVDKSEFIDSQSFEIELWNPQDQGLHGRFVDGSALLCSSDNIGHSTRSL